MGLTWQTGDGRRGLEARHGGEAGEPLDALLQPDIEDNRGRREVTCGGGSVAEANWRRATTTARPTIGGQLVRSPGDEGIKPAGVLQEGPDGIQGPTES